MAIVAIDWDHISIGNARDNRTDSERFCDTCRQTYTLPLLWQTQSQTTPPNRLWFRRDVDRQAFRRTFEAAGCIVEIPETTVERQLRDEAARLEPSPWYVTELTPEAAMAFDRRVYNVGPGVTLGWTPYIIRVTYGAVANCAFHNHADFDRWRRGASTHAPYGLQAPDWSPWQDGVRYARLIAATEPPFVGQRDVPPAERWGARGYGPNRG